MFELIAPPFTKESVALSIIPEFLRSIGINSSQFRGTKVRRNEAVGPFTVAVAREVLRSIGDNNKPLKWLQAERCKKELAAYLDEKGWADARYCGLSTALARHIERELESDNNAFAQSVWGRPWAEIFSADVAEEFTPNDFEMHRPDWFTARRLRRTVREMNTIAEEILGNPSFAIEALWNDWQHRSGLVHGCKFRDHPRHSRNHSSFVSSWSTICRPVSYMANIQAFNAQKFASRFCGR